MSDSEKGFESPRHYDAANDLVLFGLVKAGKRLCVVRSDDEGYITEWTIGPPEYISNQAEAGSRIANEEDMLQLEERSRKNLDRQIEHTMGPTLFDEQ